MASEIHKVVVPAIKLVEDEPDTSVCPLCAGGNNCALVVSVESSEPCWCESLKVSQKVLDLIPLEARNVSCVCRECIVRYSEGGSGGQT